MSYGLMEGYGYEHGTVKHGEDDYAHYDYRSRKVHHTNHVESFWRLFKKSVDSTHIHISEKYAARYLDEFAFRSNHRQMRNAMFDLLICGALTSASTPSSNAARSIGPVPRAFSCSTNLSKRPAFKASVNDSMHRLLA